MCYRIAPDYEMDESGLLILCPRSSRSSEERIYMIRLVVPELLQRDFASCPHEFGRGPRRDGKNVSADPIEFLLRYIYRSVQRYVDECVD